MAARQLGLLRVLRSKLIANAIQELDVALLRVLLHGRDKGPRHGAGGLSCDRGIGPTNELASNLPPRERW